MRVCEQFIHHLPSSRKVLLPILMHHDNEEAVAESARIMANYSRYEDVQQLLVKEHGLALFTILLDHVHREVVYQAVGVLVNLSTRGGALIIMENDGFEK